MKQLGHFEENLLTELRAVVAEQAPPPRRALPRKRLALATAGVGLLAAGLLVGIPAMHGTQAPAAYAVTANDDGTVTVSVSRLEDPDGLERELATHGITAEIDFLPPGKWCQNTPPRYQVEPNQVRDVFVRVDLGDDTLTFRPADVAGRTLVLEGWHGPAFPERDIPTQFVFHYTVVNGPVAPCVPVDMPVEPHR